jgi:hypothetical protein
MNERNWYFLGFTSLTVWTVVMFLPFCATEDAQWSGFDLLFNLVIGGGSYISKASYVGNNVAQAVFLTVVFLGVSIYSVRKARVAASR